MKLENFTDLQNWAVEQWRDAELGDSRRKAEIAATFNGIPVKQESHG
ncbi:hypothetical protein [aff. Roholtiella sp. LEGE 12411]|nr:hypothetical protein [aff. Roholtiella sp. LEGE 12411]MBE9037293.1 hypothetical protein [aff. Roholtiella sp. LEGE 12411]